MGSKAAVRIDLQAVGFFGEFYTLAKGFGPISRGIWAHFEGDLGPFRGGFGPISRGIWAHFEGDLGPFRGGFGPISRGIWPHFEGDLGPFRGGFGWAFKKGRILGTASISLSVKAIQRVNMP